MSGPRHDFSPRRRARTRLRRHVIFAFLLLLGTGTCTLGEPLSARAGERDRHGHRQRASEPRTPAREEPAHPLREDASQLAALNAQTCRTRLEAEGIGYRPAERKIAGAVFPVRLTGAIAGVNFRIPWSKNQSKDKHAIWDCRLVLAMLPVARWLAAREIVEVQYFSAFRVGGNPKSQHRKALGFDLRGLRAEGEREFALVEDHYPKGMIESCRPGDWQDPRSYAELYAGLVCFAWQHRLFHTVLTPDHDHAHHNHLHLDLKARQSHPANPYVVVASGVLPSPTADPRQLARARRRRG